MSFSYRDETKELKTLLERLDSHFDYTSTEGIPFIRIQWHTMAHLVNQGTQHRSEAAAILTDFCHSPGELDLIYFLSEM